MKYLQKFENYASYEETKPNLILPNVVLCVEENGIYYNPYVAPETRVVAKFNITDTNNPTQIISQDASLLFSSIEIDCVEQPSVVSEYIFNTIGEHTVKYTLTNPTSIDDESFSECSNLTSIDIPSSVTSIGNRAFGWCSSLTSVTIPDSVTSIGDNAFYNCKSLTSITIGNGVTSIGNSAFENCRGLTIIVIPSGVTSIGSRVFEWCSKLTSVTIPNSVKSIGEYAFGYCSSLISITIPNSVTNIGNWAFSSCSGLTSVTISNSVISIGKYAFGYCSSLTNIISNAITAPTIQNNSFRDVKTGGTLTVPSGSSGYDVWMGTGDYYLGKYNWTKVEQ